MECVADDDGAFADFLFHEVAEIAFADGGAGEAGDFDFAVDLLIGGVEEGGAGAGEGDPIAIEEVGDAAGEGGEGEGVGAEIHFVIAEADGEGGAATGADDEFGVIGEDEGEGVGAFEAAEGFGGGLQGREATGEVIIEELGDGFGIGFGGEDLAGGFEFGAERQVVFDDAVMDDGDAGGAVRVGVGFGGGAVGGPACVADAGGAGEGGRGEGGGEVGEFALGAAAGDGTVDQGGDASTVIAAIGEAAEAVEQEV